jgi:hypothetical protein
MYGKIRTNKEGRKFIELLSETKKPYEDGEEIFFEIKDVRSLELHKRYFEVLRLFAENAPEIAILSLLDISPKEYLLIQKSKDILEERIRKAIEMELGYVEDEKMSLTLHDGEVINVVRKKAKSIAYGKMSEEDFASLHRGQKELVFDILKQYGWSNEQLKELFKNFYK